MRTLLPLFCSLMVLTMTLSASEPYRDSSLSVEERVADLLARMTIDEKLAQLQGVWIKRHELEDKDGKFIPVKAKEHLGYGIGHVSRPSEQTWTGTPNKSPEATVRFVNDVQRWLVENTRLGIPALFHEEGLHGHAAPGATSFPQAIALASSWDPVLIEQVYTVTAREMRARGGQQALTPILDVARDPRWGRIEETMGEDPYLVGALGVAAVHGFQGRSDTITSDRVIATLKHLAGHGEPRGGLNVAPTPIGERELREVFLTPFEAAVTLAGAQSVMASYNEIDGIPSHANQILLHDILRKEWGFKGSVVSDYFAITELQTRHAIVATKQEAALLALQSGVDIELPDGDAFYELKSLVKQDPSVEADIDRALTNILNAKFSVGLFENPYTHASLYQDVIGHQDHRKLALRAAERSMVLLKNDDQLLPLDIDKITRFAVIGPHADETLLGGYSDVPTDTVSILRGLKEKLAGQAEVIFARGPRITEDNFTHDDESVRAHTRSKQRWTTDEVVMADPAKAPAAIKEAVALAKRSDVALVVVGGNEATSREAWSEPHLGDRTSLKLPGEQQALVDAVLATGTPTIVLLINGQPLAITEIAEKAPAIIEGWYLGQETGTAVANVLFGDANPGGKLPVSIPRSVGQLPVYYNYKPTAKRGYSDSDTAPLFSFGFGLSYTSFNYSDLAVDDSHADTGGYVSVDVSIQNSGERAGDEVVQLYIRDKIASVTRPIQELKGFQRISLEPGASTRLRFKLPLSLLGFYGRDMRYRVEPGDIELMIGSASNDIRLRSTFTVRGDILLDVKKAFLSETSIVK